MSPRHVLLSLLTCLTLLTPPMAWSDSAKGEARKCTDRYGDLLPSGAIARLGTIRLRHGNGVMALAFSPDGKSVAAGDGDSRVSIWDVATGKELHRLPKVENAVKRVVFSPDGKRLAFVTIEGRIIYLYDAATGKEIRKVKLEADSTETLAFSPDGKFLAWGSRSKVVHLWDVGAAKEIPSLTGFGQIIGSLTFTPDGRFLLVSNADGEFTLSGAISQRDLASGKEIRRFKINATGTRLNAVVFTSLVALSPDGKHLVSVAEDGKLRLWRLASGAELWRGRKWDGDLRMLTFSPDGKLLAVADWDQEKRIGAVRLLDAATGRELRRLQGLDEAVNGIRFSPDGKAIAIGGWDHCVRFFNPATGIELPRRDGHQAKIHTVAFCLNGERVATGADDGSFRLWETATGKELRRIDNDRGRCCKVASFDVKHLILMGESSPIRIWDMVGDKELRRRDIPGEMPWKRGFSDAGETALLMRNEHVRIWNVMTGEVRRQIDTRGISMLQAILSPDGRALAACDMKDTACVWDVGGGKVRRIDGADGFVFSRDGKTLAYRSREGVCLWETATGRERGWLRGGREMLFHFAFSPDGRLLASGGKDGTIHLWNPAAGRELASSSAHRGWVNDLSFSPDGKRLVSAGDDTTALVWDVERMLPAEPPPRQVTAKELQGLWSDLASADAPRAYRAIHGLRSAGSPAVRLLAERLRPPQLAKEHKDIARFLAELDSEVFATREMAMRQLEKLGPWAESHLQAKLKERPSLEVRKRLEMLLKRLEEEENREPQGEILRSLRALEALEMIGTAEARAVLEILAKTAADARLMREAKASLGRMRQRSSRLGIIRRDRISSP